MDQISLKDFLQQVQQLCEGMTQDELTGFIKQYVSTYAPADRERFIRKLSGFTSESAPKELDASLVEALEDLVEEMKQYRLSIEDGTWYDDDYEEIIPEPVLDTHVFMLRRFFRQSDELFLSGSMKAAVQLYDKLFAVLEEDDCLNSRKHQLLSNYRETKARYYRSIYESVPPARRPKVLLERMLQGGFLEVSYPSGEPTLADIICTREGDIPGFEAFLSIWCRLLAEGNTEGEQVLLLEAVHMTEGLSGVMRLARLWKDTQPRGYLYWITILAGQENWQGVVDVSQEALAELPISTPMRAIAASSLHEGAAHLGLHQLVLEGKLHEFISDPQEVLLEAMLKEAYKQDSAQEVLDRCVQIMQYQNSRKLLRIVQLLHGSAVQVLHASEGKCSDFFFAVSTVLLVSSQLDKAHTVRHFARRNLTETQRYTRPDAYFLPDAVIKAISCSHVPEELQEQAYRRSIAWGTGIIESIVSNQHRYAYYDAAVLLACLAECIAVREGQSHSQAFIRKYRNELFVKYSTFRRRISEVIRDSPLIRNL